MSLPIILFILGALCIFAYFVYEASAIFSGSAGMMTNPMIFFTIIFLSLLALHWPLITWKQELNLDESQMLAQGMRFRSHPVPWRDVDSTTSGPLNSMVLAAAMRLGAPPVWLTARLMLWICQCGTLGFIYLVLRRFGTRAEAQFTLMPPIIFYAFSQNLDFIHYSSETFSILLLAANSYVLALEWTKPKKHPAGLFLAGMIAGAIPFAKLQAAPLAIFMFATAVMIIFFRSEKLPGPPRNRTSQIFWLCLGGLIVPICILGPVAFTGAFGDFWKSYILASGTQEATQESPFVKLRHCAFVFLSRSDFNCYFAIGIISALALGVIVWFKKALLPGQLWWPLCWVISFGLLSVGCIYMAGKPLLHYALLTVLPIAILIGLTFQALKNYQLFGKSVAWPSRIVAFALILIMGLQFFQVFFKFKTDVSYYASLKSPSTDLVVSKVTEASRPGDTLSIWGWVPEYFTETGLMPATRDAIAHYTITPGRFLEYHRERYLADLKKSQPAIFVDAVADGKFLCWDTWTKADGHESFPELAKFIDENYSLWLTVQYHVINKKPVGAPVRIYLSKKRMAELHATPAFIDLPPQPRAPSV